MTIQEQIKKQIRETETENREFLIKKANEDLSLILNIKPKHDKIKKEMEEFINE